MTALPNVPDPAQDLWDRIEPVELARFASFAADVPVPIGAVAEALGLEVISTTLPPDISGLIRQIEMDQPIYQVQVNNTDAPVRQRFTVAHEVAHYLLHRASIGTDGITDTILYRSKLTTKVETEANRLAAALLLPWQKVRVWHWERFTCSPEASHIDEIAKAFKVSALAVGFRFGF